MKKIFFLGCVIITFFLYIYYLFSTLKFVNLDNSPAHWDYAVHLLYGLKFADLIKESGYAELLGLYHYYPPLLYILYAIIVLLFGYSELIPTLLNFSLLLVLLIFTYFYSYREHKSKLISYSSLFTVLGLTYLSPKIGVNLSELMLDFPLSVFLYISYFYLLSKIRKNEYDTTSTILISLLISFALLTKWVALVFLFLPILFYLFKLIQQKKINNLAIFFALLTVLVVPWLLTNVSKLMSDAIYVSLKEGYESKEPQNLESLLSYYFTFKEFIGLYAINLLFSLAVIIFLLIKNKIDKLFITTQIIFMAFPIFVFTFIISNFDARYLYPIYIWLFLSVYWMSICQAGPFLKKLFFLSILFITLSVFLTTGFKKTNLADHPLKILKENFKLTNPSSVAYFFENDSRWFNYANVRLMHKELELAYLDIPFAYLNNFAENPDLVSCPDAKTMKLIVVFSDKNDHTGQNISFEKSCAGLAKNDYKFYKKLTFPKIGTLTLLKAVSVN